MSKPQAPRVTCEMHHPELVVRDVLAAATFYEGKLGFERGFTWGDPLRMAGMNLGGVSVHLRQCTAGPEAGAVWFVIGYAGELHELHRSSGPTSVRPLQYQAWGFRDFKV